MDQIGENTDRTFSVSATVDGDEFTTPFEIQKSGNIESVSNSRNTYSVTTTNEPDTIKDNSSIKIYYEDSRKIYPRDEESRKIAENKVTVFKLEAKPVEGSFVLEPIYRSPFAPSLIDATNTADGILGIGTYSNSNNALEELSKEESSLEYRYVGKFKFLTTPANLPISISATGEYYGNWRADFNALWTGVENTKDPPFEGFVKVEPLYDPCVGGVCNLPLQAFSKLYEHEKQTETIAHILEILEEKFKSVWAFLFEHVLR
jgi:hypothetical protein